jgi:UDP-N-acetylglucosamine acyltransferase
MDCLPFVTTTGSPARALGLNVVGLRRAAIGADERRILKEAYRILLLSRLPLSAALERMAELGDPLVDEMVAFVRGSKRGFHLAERAREAETE